MVVFAVSVTISVKAQKNGGLCDQPMGNIKGMAMSGKGLCGMSLGMKTTKPRVTAGKRGAQ